ncbi:hypothetical protein C2E21_9412 [Chlorella sorokiniana]|uniref:Uncharacterized protein n=1 Tax=Chlorella sorokiniana TaxID=3076 RepID=A0A2P6TBI2_CHLSO|nr:hypothetical protein C2E21_9412 [Chlorella sorokiniana]|eukprot:PRW05914.1 hypothetical protein C2E21_9412 [Chlorella sorokiniana]
MSSGQAGSPDVGTDGPQGEPSAPSPSWKEGLRQRQMAAQAALAAQAASGGSGSGSGNSSDTLWYMRSDGQSTSLNYFIPIGVLLGLVTLACVFVGFWWRRRMDRQRRHRAAEQPADPEQGRLPRCSLESEAGCPPHLPKIPVLIVCPDNKPSFGWQLEECQLSSMPSTHSMHSEASGSCASANACCSAGGKGSCGGKCGCCCGKGGSGSGCGSGCSSPTCSPRRAARPSAAPVTRQRRPPMYTIEVAAPAGEEEAPADTSTPPAAAEAAAAAAAPAAGGELAHAARLERSGSVACWRAAHAGGGGCAAGAAGPHRRLQPRPTVPGIRPAAFAGASSSGKGNAKSIKGAAAETRYRGGPKPSPVPDVDAEQLLRSLGLSGTADPAALLTNLRKLPGMRQQGVLDNAAAVAAHLRSPAVGLTPQQAGQLLERCPELFSWTPEQRAAVLFGELLGAGLTAAAAAQCFIRRPAAARSTTLAPGLAELPAILAHSEDRDSSLGGRVAKVPAAQRTVAVLLTKTPSAVQLVCQRAGYLQQRAAELQQVGFTAADVAALAWDLPELLTVNATANVASRAAVLQHELGLPPAQVVSLVASRKPGWLSSSVIALQEGAAALAEGFGQDAAAGMVLKSPEVPQCDSMVWQRNLCVMAACGVADPTAVLRQCPLLLHHDHAGPTFVQRRLILQQCTQLTAAQLYEQHPRWLYHRKVPDLAQRLQFVEHCGSDMRQLMVYVLFEPLKDLLPAVGASQAKWEAWAAANPPAACPLFRWAQQSAAEEAARLAAALPPELAQWVPQQYPRGRRAAAAGS